MQIQAKKKNLIILLFALTYMVSYMTRINYGAVVSEMQLELGETKRMLSMALTGSFVTYGVGQIIVGILGERIKPKRLVFIGLLITTCMNALIPFFKNPWAMLFIWSVNGFAQAFMWPPIVKFMSELFSEKDYKKCSFTVSCGGSAGTCAIYLLVPFLINKWGYRSVFWVCACFGAIMATVWQITCVDVEINKNKEETKKANGKFFTFLLFGIMIAIVCMGMLRDGITTWMPSYISEIYQTGNAIAILTGVVLPIFSVLSYFVTTLLHKKAFKNPITCAGVIFALACVCSFLLLFVSGNNAVLSVFAMATVTGCMHGINLMLISFVPRYFISTGRVSTVSGILNSCTYVGSAISTYGVAALVEKSGWNIAIAIWTAVCLIGLILCFACAIPWRKKYPSEE